jgi:UDP-N-acetylglucosamine 2-epimerase (non-hydrolysing)
MAKVYYSLPQVSTMHIYFYIGTTAEFIKLAPIIKELKKRKINFKLITTGQNKIKFKDLEDYTGQLKVHIALKEKGDKSSIGNFFMWGIKTLFVSLTSLHNEFKNLNKTNSYFIIHGDTISALIGAIVAKRYGLKLVHIESGLRSFDFIEPFPEEICRFIIIHLADILCSPTDWAMNNLQKFKSEKITTHENTLLEPCLWALNKVGKINFKNKFGKYYIVIMHRQEHVYFQKEWTRNTLDLLINNASKNLNCIFIMHSLTSRFLETERLDTNEDAKKRLLLLPTLPYVDFMNLMSNAEFIATDGCTNQEEAYYMGLPMLSLRNKWERIEGIGENVVISKGNKRIITNFLKNYKKYTKDKIKINKSPSKIIVDYLLK